MSALEPLCIGLVSVSDRAATGVYEDKGIPALKAWLQRAVRNPIRWETRLIPDEVEGISAALCELVDSVGCDLVLTTGGTGPALRDVTPDATLAVADKLMPGFGEQMRQISLNFVPTATWRDRIAVGTKRRLIWRICSPNPGICLCATASVASGVTSRSAGPVPPVVSTRSHLASSTSSQSTALMPACSSGISRVSQWIGFFSARDNQSCSAGSPKSG